MLNATAISRQLVTSLANSARITAPALRPQITSQPFSGGLRIAANGYTRNLMTQPSSTSKLTSSIISFSNLSKSAGQQRNLFTMMPKEEFDKIKDDYEIVGVHGTARWAVESIEVNGIDLGLTGKYRGGISAAGTGLYTTNNGEIAHHYARRAGFGEPNAFDLDTRPQSFVVYRAKGDKPEVAKVPSEIQGKKDQIEAFRAENPADEYDLGQTPAPPRLEKKGIIGETILITDQGLSNPKVRYVAVPLPIGEVFKPE